MIVTAHQINFLPGCSVMEKIRTADAVILLDTMQFPHGHGEKSGFTNRNRLADGAWLTIPIDHQDIFAPINRVRIADPGHHCRRKIAKKLQRELGAVADPYAVELLKPYPLLVGLNYALIRLLLADLRIGVEQYFESHVDLGYSVPAWSEDESDLLPARERLAMMVEAVGGTVYLSGPSGSRYLNEEPFHARGIEVRYFNWPEGTPNPSAIETLRERRAA